jgi:hypothetical protein
VIAGGAVSFGCSPNVPAANEAMVAGAAPASNNNLILMCRVLKIDLPIGKMTFAVIARDFAVRVAMRL